MAAIRRADVIWSGPLATGSGSVSASTSSAFSDLPVTWASRTEAADGRTSPEELVAAAHASCFAMALNGAVGRKGGAIAKTHITATVIADKGATGIKLTTSKLKVVAEGLQGIAAGDFEAVAKEAESKCPISNALRGTMQIEVQGSAK